MLQPRASSPPSAKKDACTVNTEAMTRKAACGPRRIARIIPPPRWPLDPVPGIVKLIIWDAKMNAPTTPIRGIFRSSRLSRSFREACPIVPIVPAQRVAPTAGDSNASAMCILASPYFPPPSGVGEASCSPRNPSVNPSR
jgi:hypothetical protein